MEESKIGLDLKNRDVPYLLGRILAIVNYKNELNPVFINEFSVRPLAGLGRMASMKIDNDVSKEISEIMNFINVKAIPQHYMAEDQGKLIVGFYHQQNFMMKSDSMDIEEEL